MTGETIFALSSGSPPSAIAIVRISGPRADEILAKLTPGPEKPRPRVAVLRTISDPETAETLDRALVLRFPGPESSTGEDVVELHLHGGRSVVEGVMNALTPLDGVRAAQAGEFTRRAFENGRMDLAEAEGLADLLAAETQSQRRAALALAGGVLSRQIGQWQSALLELAAAVEALLDFSDEGDVVDSLSNTWLDRLNDLAHELEAMLRVAPAERLRDGVRVVIAGPPNAGKSSLLNKLVGRQAAITSEIAGTTRDVIEAPISLGGWPFLLVDTAGLREAADEIEAIGIERANETLAGADVVLWLGDAAHCPDPDRTIQVAAKADVRDTAACVQVDVEVSAKTGQGIQALVALMIERARRLLPQEGEVAINRRHREAIVDCLAALRTAETSTDLLITAESLRVARGALDRVTGRAGVEDMLDRLFGGFCIGK